MELLYLITVALKHLLIYLILADSTQQTPPTGVKLTIQRTGSS